MSKKNRSKLSTKEILLLELTYGALYIPFCTPEISSDIK